MSVEQYAETHAVRMGLVEAIKSGMAMWVSGRGWIHMDDLNKYADEMEKAHRG